MVNIPFLNRVSTIQGLAGFLPSTVFPAQLSCSTQLLQDDVCGRYIERVRGQIYRNLERRVTHQAADLGGARKPQECETNILE